MLAERVRRYIRDVHLVVSEKQHVLAAKLLVNPDHVVVRVVDVRIRFIGVEVWITSQRQAGVIRFEEIDYLLVQPGRIDRIRNSVVIELLPRIAICRFLGSGGS